MSRVLGRIGWERNAVRSVDISARPEWEGKSSAACRVQDFGARVQGLRFKV